MKIFVLFFLCFLGLAAPAAELVTFGQNLRNFGMGGVRTYDGDQASVILWNPAGTAFSNGLRWDVFDLGAGINGQDAYNLAQSASAVTGIDDLGPFYGNPIWIGAAGNTGLMLPHFGLVYYQDIYANLILHNPVLPEMDVTYYNDSGILLGSALKFGNLGVGMNIKQVRRKGSAATIGADLLNSISATTLSTQFEDGGTGYGVDLGLMYKPDVIFNPMISLGYQNVGDTTFQLTSGTTAPPKLEDNLTLGATFGAGSFLGGIAGGIEYRHINTSGEPIGKKIHMGLELSLLNLDLRTGLYQGYPTFGVGVDLFLFQFDAALYTIERGAYPGQTPEQRVQFSLSSSFGFNPDLSFSDIGGKRRKLKQRR